MDKRRQTAYKCCLGELTKGSFVKGEGLEPGSIITNLGRKVSRIRVLATVVNKFVNDDKTYGFLVLDDSTETLRVKIWQNIKIIENIQIGDLVDVTGKIREYDGELYVMPEIVRKVDANWEILRRAELAEIWQSQKNKIEIIKSAMKQIADQEELKIYVKEKHSIDPEESVAILQNISKSNDPQPKVESASYKDKILNIILTVGGADGADFGAIMEESKLDENIIDSTLNELLESGAIYEPRPGKFKKL